MNADRRTRHVLREPRLPCVFVFLVALAAPVPRAGAQPAGNAPTSGSLFLWTIRSDRPSDAGAVSYLFGTIHRDDEPLRAITARLEPLLDEVDAAYGEFGKMDARVARIRDDRSLRQLLADDLCSSLTAVLRRHGRNPELDLWYEVWYVHIIVSGIASSQMGEHVVLDDQIRRMAWKRQMNVGGLESSHELRETWLVFTEEEQAQLLVEQIQNVEAAEEDAAAMRAAWQPLTDAYLTGSEERVVEFLAASSGDSDSVGRRFAEVNSGGRNPRMADRIALFVRHGGRKRYLFFVGVGHVVGGESIVALLRAQGFTVERAYIDAIVARDAP